MIYQGVAASEAEYIGRGPTHSSHAARESLHAYFFCKFFGENSTTNQSAKADVQLSLVEVAAKADLCL